jgi:hypothetical protein
MLACCAQTLEAQQAGEDVPAEEQSHEICKRALPPLLPLLLECMTLQVATQIFFAHTYLICAMFFRSV